MIRDPFALVRNMLALVRDPLAPGHCSLTRIDRLLTLLQRRHPLSLQIRTIRSQLRCAPLDLGSALLNLEQSGLIPLLQPGDPQPLQLATIHLQQRRHTLKPGGPPLELGPLRLTALIPPAGRLLMTPRGLLMATRRLGMACSAITHVFGCPPR